MYYLLLPSLDARQALIAYLKTKSILSVFHYLPLHLSDRGRSFGGREGQCPVTEDVSDRLLRLPFFFALSETDQEQVVAAVLQFSCD
jgi:dTDP-4-amino-4,6-dideoxygalactose transaminase